MKTLKVALPFLVFAGWLVGAGCDSDTGAVDIGVGGIATTIAGAPNAGEGGTTAAAGGDSGGNAGAGGAAECPANIVGLDGKPCSVPGMICSDGADDPCFFGHSIICVAGKWQDQESFPAPCGGAGGAAGAGGAGEAGGAAGVGGNP
jgi:hypothetical protein